MKAAGDARAPVRGAVAPGAAPGWLILAVTLLCGLPLLLTPVLPLVDFYAHAARYYALAHVDTDPVIAANYAPAWQLLPNLGLDIVGTRLVDWMPPLAAAKLIGLVTVLAPFAGILALARVLHGHVPLASLLLAGLLAFNHILIWGFANFLLGLGIAFAGLALWIGLRDRPVWQLLASGALGLALFFVHGLAFALWGLMLGAVELMLAAEAGALRPAALLRRAGRLASLAVLPAVLFLQMPTSGAEEGVTAAFTNLQNHAEAGRFWSRVGAEAVERIDVALRVVESGHPWIDRGLGLVLWTLLGAGLWTGALRLHRYLRAAVLLSLAMIVVMPPNLFGVGYLDDRTPLVALGLVAAGLTVAPLPRRAPALVAGLAVLLVARTALLGADWAREGTSYRAYLGALAQAETGEIGAAALLGETGARDTTHTRCTPLSFLMLLENGTAVRTFAFPTQQPLRLAGPLAAAEQRFSQSVPDPDADPVADRLARLAAAGFDSIVACHTTAPDPPPGMTRAAHHAPWTLYTRTGSGT